MRRFITLPAASASGPQARRPPWALAARQRFFLVVLAAAAQGCLPADDRPEPGSVLLNVQRSAVAVDGFTTDDGWTISFDRFVTDIGQAGLTGDGCVDYSLSTYDRLYDFEVADYSKVSLHYGLGQCTIAFSIHGPQEDAILMAGATSADRTLMSTRATDALTQDDQEHPVSVMVIGSAERGSETKRFSWLIRGNHHVGACYTPAADTNLSAISLNGGDSSSRDLEVRPQELFRHTPSLTAPFEFERLAQADEDGDGSITLDELVTVSVPAAEIIADLADEMPDRSAGDVAKEVGTPTLGSLIFDILSLRIVALAGAGECMMGQRSRDFGPF
jgi:hypothetical protein